ncbi:two-component sensor histidine kinase [Lichenibacterium minor]|uniref:histidine kinase n=1 Tax=Lichenibacterium minor TaxID=2316528 RepID=A0A4Q2UBK4_9HYPH|nr:ATP-binding protein [Lichenibacterium minor]RYC34020.1 two-component sensor histidine kinase [Lichenibacterium minor]
MLDTRQPSATAALVAALIDAMPEPVLAVTGEGRVLAANAPAKTVMPALRIGGDLTLALRDPDILDAVDRVLISGQIEQVSWRDRVPVERVFDVTVAPLDRPDEDRALVLTLRDVTESLRIERMRADFVANASHELRTPLASLLGFVETLQGPARDDARARDRFLAIMADQARRMARLIDDLLSLSRIEQNLHVRPNKPVDLALAARHVAETLGPLAAESGTAIGVEAGEPVVVAGDHDELLRVAENLVENAIKYADGRVEVKVRVQRRSGVLTVRDYGPGIAPEHLPRLTERFYRIDAGQSRAKGGTGLGLAIVKHIVARHRGRLQIDSDLGHGTLITVAIPLKT